jgi:hypothetical protein
MKRNLMPAPKGHPAYPGCEKGGRPKIWTDERIEEEAEALLDWLKEEDNFYFYEFLYLRDLQEDYPSKWAKKNEKFNQAYKRARIKQQLIVGKSALSKAFDSGFSKFFLQCNYKWKEDSDTSGLEETSSTPGSRALADLKQVCIEHNNTLEQTSDKPSDV